MKTLEARTKDLIPDFECMKRSTAFLLKEDVINNNTHMVVSEGRIKYLGDILFDNALRSESIHYEFAFGMASNLVTLWIPSLKPVLLVVCGSPH